MTTEKPDQFFAGEAYVPSLRLHYYQDGEKRTFIRPGTLLRTKATLIEHPDGSFSLATEQGLISNLTETKS